MKQIRCDNGVHLGDIIWKDNCFKLKPIKRNYTEYMLEQALERIRECRTR